MNATPIVSRSQIAQWKKDGVLSSKPRGRPKGPEKVVFKARVTPEEKLLLEVQVDKFRSGATKVVGSNLGGREPTKEAIPNPSDALQPPDPAWALVEEINGLKDTQKALLEDVERLSQDVKSLEHDLEEARSMDLDSKGTFWRNEYLKLKAIHEHQFSQ